jgi:diphosphoinositol-polyphosphate diphosphatase
MSCESLADLGTSCEPLADVVRTFDDDGYRRRAGCICLAGLSLGTDLCGKVLLASSSSKKNGWVLPAGGIDPGETPDQAAIRELHEEAGAVSDLQSLRFLCWVEDSRKKTRTAVYLATATALEDTYAEASLRSRTWVSVDEAVALLAKSPSQSLVFGTAVAAAGGTLLTAAGSATVGEDT